VLTAAAQWLFVVNLEAGTARGDAFAADRSCARPQRDGWGTTSRAPVHQPGRRAFVEASARGWS
jgi:hypothetical protein